MLDIDPLDIEEMESAKREFLVMLELKYHKQKAGNSLLFKNSHGKVIFIINGAAYLIILHGLRNDDPMGDLIHPHWLFHASRSPTTRFFDYAAKNGILT